MSDTKKFLWYCIAAVSFAALLALIAGCGGGGGNTNSQQPPSTAVKSVVLSCAGGSCAVKTDATLQLAANVTCVTANNCDANISAWAVCEGIASAPTNCVQGGNSDLGVIDNSGLYTAPVETVPNSGSVIIKAIASDNSTSLLSKTAFCAN